jgi:hypothetical protein
MRHATLLAGVAALFLATGAVHAVEIPKQYRGEWCLTQWQTIYKRCPSGEVIIDRTSWSSEDEACTYSAIRKSKHGGHILSGVCWTKAVQEKANARKNAGG